MKETKIKIKGKWYILCACNNCSEVHAFHKDSHLDSVDVGIKCCDNPDNWCPDEAKDDATMAVQEFVEKYPHREYKDKHF